MSTPKDDSRLETHRQVGTAYLFDVDGVLTDPVEKRVDREEIFSEIISRLQSGQPVAFNTGRSTKWVFENVITPMLDRVEDKSIFQNAIVIGEKGGSWALFDESGTASHHLVSTLSIPEELSARINALIEEKYSTTMGNLDPKQTMFSVEMNDGLDLATFHAAQLELKEDLVAILEQHGYTDKLRIDLTTIATDIENPHVGKALGTERFIGFLKQRNIKAKRFIAFGDSSSDLAMADELARQGRQVEMVYVGDASKIRDAKKPYSITTTPGHTHAVAAYLSNEKS